jgi:hypothetical protein
MDIPPPVRPGSGEAYAGSCCGLISSFASFVDDIFSLGEEKEEFSMWDVVPGGT